MSVDKDLVEAITRQVIERLGAEGASSSHTSSASSFSSDGGLGVVLTDGSAGVEEAIQQINALSGSFSHVTLFLTKCSENTGVGNVFASRISGARVIKEKEGARTRDLLSSSKVIVFPICTTTTAAKIGFLMADTKGTRIGIGALQSRIPVVITTNSMNALGAHSAQFQGIASEHIARLNSLGVITCDVRELGSRVSSAGSVGAPSVSAAPSFSSAAPVASAASNSTLRAPSATISCQSAIEDVRDFLISALADDPNCAPCAATVREAIDQCVIAGACRVGTLGIAEPETHSGGGMAGMIDHTFLKPNGTPDDIEKLCVEARKYRFKSVCINPGYVSMCSRLLKGSGVLVCTVVGFPLGATTSSSKASETRDAIADGADEIDMVINIGRLKAGDYDKVRSDVAAVVEAAKGRTVKVILETALLTDEEKVAGCQCSVAGGAHFVKTSTGFSGGGATPEDIALMRKVVGPNIGVKASGGVRTREDAERMIAAGANRVGASSSITIATGKETGEKGY